MLGSDEIERLFISPTASIREATKLLDKGGKGIVLVVDPARRLVGTITDGDLRRAMLAGIDFELPVTTLLERKEPRYRKPFWVPEGTSPDDMIQLMRNQVIRQLPVLDRDGAVVGLVTQDDLLPSTEPVEAVIYAHGDHWKHSLLPIGNRSLLQSVIQRLQHSGIEQVRIFSNGQTDPIESQLRAEVSTSVAASAAPWSSSNGACADEHKSTLQIVITAPILTQVDYRSMIQFHHEHHAEMT
ncbi:MAG: CBS domain-containing protein, partial [Gemmataceae bacterium]|nr:CBS domain-containing protein [Gemmataceae bacterium]